MLDTRWEGTESLAKEFEDILNPSRWSLAMVGDPKIYRSLISNRRCLSVVHMSKGVPSKYEALPQRHHLPCESPHISLFEGVLVAVIFLGRCIESEFLRYCDPFLRSGEPVKSKLLPRVGSRIRVCRTPVDKGRKGLVP